MPLVVIRHLPGSRPVTHCIINETHDGDVTDQDHYLKSEAETSINNFKAMFPEFEAATFYMDIIPPGSVL